MCKMGLGMSLYDLRRFFMKATPEQIAAAENMINRTIKISSDVGLRAFISPRYCGEYDGKMIFAFEHSKEITEAQAKRLYAYPKYAMVDLHYPDKFFVGSEIDFEVSRNLHLLEKSESKDNSSQLSGVAAD